MESFTLHNKPSRRKLKIEAVRHVQPLIFLGSHTDLPDQQDLFDRH